MIKIKVSSQLDSVDNVSKLFNPDLYLRPVAIEMIPIMAERIHDRGEDSNEEQIGTYSDAYMVVRTGSYQNAEKLKKGKNAGKQKNAGFTTKTSIQIAADKRVFLDISEMKIKRQAYNRSSDTKVVVSLTRQLENDYAVIGTTTGWSIGFNNKINYQKAEWVEKTYNKKIFKFTPEEREKAKEKINREVQKIINGN